MKTSWFSAPHDLRRYRNAMAMLFVGLAIGVAGFSAGCASVPPVSNSTLSDRWGIEITSLRMSGKGHLIDFRYRVLDPDKAATLADRRYQPVMIDEATGTRLKIPSTPKIGPLRQTASRLEAGKVYFMLFSNAGRLVKAGSRMTIEIGDFQVKSLTVQ